MSFDPDLSLLAERLARECGPALLGVVEQWTVAAQSALNEPSALERLEQLGGEVEAVGFLLGCLGAARGTDVLHERRERTLARQVLDAMRRPLRELRQTDLSVAGELPVLKSQFATWHPAVTLAVAAWRVRRRGRVVVHVENVNDSVELHFEGGVDWDDAFLREAELQHGLRATPDGLRFPAAIVDNSGSIA